MTRHSPDGQGARLRTAVAGLELKNPVIAAAAEHLITPEGLRAAVRAGAGAVVVKSANEVPAAKEMLRRAEYAVFDENWNRLEWNAKAPRSSTIACRSGLSPQPFEQWLEQAADFNRHARQHDCVAVASIVLADIGEAVRMAKQVEQAGLPVLEFNIGTPYARQSGGAVATELSPACVALNVGAIRASISLPLWVKISGQSEQVPELARSAFEAGANAVVMAGRLLGFIPDVETMTPMLGTTLGVGGPWNLPLTCHWLASTREAVGPSPALIGINGAQSGLDVARMMLAGASAAGIASPVMLRGFAVVSEAVATLGDYLAAKGLTAAELVGRAADSRKAFDAMPDLGDNWKNHVPRAALDPDQGKVYR